MQSATRFGWGVTALAVFIAAQAYGVQPPTSEEAREAAAQLSQPPRPPQQSTMRSASGQSNSDAGNRPAQPLYENSAARSGGQNMSMSAAQSDNGANRTSANGQQRGEIGVWLVENGGQGVRVARLARGAAADQAGLRSGDIILQVNGNNVDSPRTAAEQIRGIPVGQTANLTLLRDGGQQQVQVTLATARPGQSYQVGYGGENDDSGDRGARNSNGDSSGLAARTARLEQQMESMTEELRQMRQQMSSMRASGAGIGTEQPGAGLGTTPNAPSAAPTNVTPPQSGAGGASSSSSTTPSPSPATGTSSAGTSAPSSSTSGSPGSDTQDLFGTGSSSSGTSPAGGPTK